MSMIELTDDEVNVLLSHLSLRENILKQLLSAARQSNDTANFNYFHTERKIISSILSKVHVSRYRAN